MEDEYELLCNLLNGVISSDLEYRPVPLVWKTWNVREFDSCQGNV